MKKRINLIIDRFEEDLAVLIDEKGGEIIFPEKYLPKEAKESDIISFELAIDEKETKKKKKEIKRLIDKLRKKP